MNVWNRSLNRLFAEQCPESAGGWWTAVQVPFNQLTAVLDPGATPPRSQRGWVQTMMPLVGRELRLTTSPKGGRELSTYAHVAGKDIALIEIGRARLIAGASATVVYEDGRGFMAATAVKPEVLAKAFRQAMPGVPIRSVRTSLPGW